MIAPNEPKLDTAAIESLQCPYCHSMNKKHWTLDQFESGETRLAVLCPSCDEVFYPGEEK